MRRKHKPGYLGPAFHEYLEYLEATEHLLLTGKPTSRDQHRNLTVNRTLFDTPTDEEQFHQLMRDMLTVDAALATAVRSSVKYKIDVGTLVEIGDRYADELVHIGHTCPIHLPHEACTIIIDGFGTDTMILVAQEETARERKPYPELDIGEDEQFICLNIGAFRQRGVELDDGTTTPNNQLSHFPVEIHSQHNRFEKDTKVIYAGAGQVDPTKKGMQTLDLLWRSFLIWHHQFHLQSILRHKQVGVGRVPRSYIPRRPRKKHEHPQFEHTVIALEVDAPDPQQTGHSIFQPRKRLHQVRGFWRHYRKSGKRVWVKPHWRGDEHLGVVRRDIELVTHQSENTA